LGKESPTKLEPVWIDCPVCSKQGCSECNNRGRFKIDGPIDLPSWVWDVLSIADRYRKGVPPIAGGSLDQSFWINQACDFVDAERQSHMVDHGMAAMLYAN